MIILLIILAVLILIAFHDVFLQKKHPILHNFPVVGHLRYLLILIGPELRQYWVANDKEEKPFDRTERRWINDSAAGENNTFGFGTTEQIYNVGYPIIKNNAFPFPDSNSTYPGDDPTAIPCLKVMGESHNRRRPFRPKSIINISAMSYGSLSSRAIEALNKGARDTGCYHNSGEGGVSKYHQNGADIMLQIGTGYFGCRDINGKFSVDKLKETITNCSDIRAIEIKLSQGAKPGKGGILPGQKVNHEIAKARGVEAYKDCISPNCHEEFNDVDSLINFIELIADATGLPIGIKAAIGRLDFWEELALKMKETNKGPDFITIDGGEGGTGAAPLTFSDHVSLPFKVGFKRVYTLFQKHEMTQDIVWIGSGKLGFPDRAIVAMVMGCDVIQIAREAMLAIGCIQAQKCHTGECPAGVATQNKWLEKGLNVESQSIRFSKYIKSLRKELISLSHAAGYEHPAQFDGSDIEFSSGVNKFSTFKDVMGYEKTTVAFKSMKDYTNV
jgi:glutamate synthase domain-containing protein 2